MAKGKAGMGKGMPPKGMPPKKMGKGMHDMGNGHMMADAEMKAMMGGTAKGKKKAK